MSEDEWLTLEGVLEPGLQALKGKSCKCLHIQQKHFAAKPARLLRGVAGVNWLRLWGTVTRPALGKVLAISGLQTLDILALSPIGRPCADFTLARELETFRCAVGLPEADILQLAASPSLKEVGLPSAALSLPALDALLEIDSLTTLDLEGTGFDDAMAIHLSHSSTLQALHLGSTRLTSRGLAALARMPQLQALDLWETNIREDDLSLLAGMSSLRYLSVGGVVEGDRAGGFTASGLLSRLSAMPALESVWVSGIPFSTEEEAVLRTVYAKVQISMD